MRGLLLFVLSGLLCGFLAGGCTERRPVDQTEICFNGTDDDGDGAVDCDDRECERVLGCVDEEDCDNGEDDDGDDDVDCDDSDCDDAAICHGLELCDNGLDDDEDGAIDCADDDCASACCEQVAEWLACDDQCDNDQDLLIDCADPDCEGAAVCRTPEDCDNGVDDDGDGDADCEDADCGGDPACPGTEDCANGVDDDEDGAVDCEDEDCLYATTCLRSEDCHNGLDDDGDGRVDCADEDCFEAPDCLEDCDNGLDDDADGSIDCGDEDCLGDPSCAEDCGNGVDDDGDGLIDCMDPACDFAPTCAELCNGVDDDGDGRVDEFPADPGLGESCYEGPPELAGVGQCEQGVWECFGGAVLCLGSVGPTEELCDGVDNDCDGELPALEVDLDCGTTIRPGEPTNLELATMERDLDVQINLDTTGSMFEEAETLRESISSTIVPEVRALLPTAAFGVSTFEDFPLAPFGSADDLPFRLYQRVTTSVALVQAGLDAVVMHNGQDLPEAGLEALYQIATGEGVSWPLADDSAREQCVGGGDEDGDGLVDCEDPDCVDAHECRRWPMQEDCGNGVDDDLDGIVDCEDPDCAVDFAWTCGYTNGACGNGTINRGEQCDDGGRDPGDGCNADCQLESGCGNARYGSWAEECDDGNLEDGDGCSSSCEREDDLCGNGTVGLGEQCDDGGTAPGDGCDESCRLEPACGNAVTEPGEACDDGNTDDGDLCPADCSGPTGGIAAIDPAEGYDPGLGHGLLGGVGFRETSIPVVVHITDASSHEGTDYAATGATAHGSTETFAALAALGVRIVAVRTGDAARGAAADDLRYPLGMALETGSVVPVCAFDGSAARVAGLCGADECCTGSGGAGLEPQPGGLCPLVFDTLTTGEGLDAQVVTGIEALSRFVTYELTARARDDGADAVDATCFVEALAIEAVSGPDGDCSLVPVTIDVDGDGLDETLTNATPRTRVTFEISAVNEDLHDVDGDGDVSEACAGPGAYGIFLDVVADGRIVVASRRLEVVVP